MLAILATLSVRALYQLPLPILEATVLLVTIVTIGRWLRRREPGLQQLMHDGVGRWSWCAQGHWRSGTLTSGCYRSRLLIVLALLDHDARTHRLCLWCDAIPARDFSYLQLQLLLLDRDTLGASSVPPQT